MASWAVWAKAGEKPKSNISDMSVLDVNLNPSVLDLVTTDIVMVALNFAREVAFNRPFMNFHDANPHGQDYKIRHAFEGTEFYGAYMTDIIKDFPMLSSSDVLKHLKNNPSVVQNQIERFREELKFIGTYKPILLAFGKDTFNILQRNLRHEEYGALIQLTHYSHQINKENYRIDTLKRLEVLHGSNA
ncbi:MAG: hypothetical protein WAT29_07150 [Thiolinea sp.]